MELALSIKGKLDSTYTAAMRETAEKASQLQKKLGDMSKASKILQGAEGSLTQQTKSLMQTLGEQKELAKTMERFRELKLASTATGNAFAQAKAKTAQMAAEFRQSQAATAQLKARLDEARRAAQAMKGSVSAEAYRAARQEVKNLANAYKESQVATRAAEQAFRTSRQNAAGLKATLASQRSELQSLRGALQAGKQLQKKLGDMSKASKILQGAEGSLTQQTKSLMQTLGEQKELAKTMERFRELKLASTATGNAFAQAKAKTAQMAAEFRQSQAATAQLKARLDEARRAAQAMKGSVSAEAYRAARQEVKNLANAYKESQVATRAAEQAFRTSRQNAAGLKATLASQRSELQSLRGALQAGKISTLDYARSYAELQARIRETNKALSENANKIQQASQKQQAGAKRDNAQSNLFAASGNFYAGMDAAKSIMSPFAGAIETAAEFEKAMSKVRAITRANDDDFKALTAEARRLGETTQFSARQSADAMSYLGMAGWNANQIIAGMPGLLALAAAGGTDLARTADIVSDDLTAFGLSADKAAHMADVFAVTATRTNTNVEMIGETMKYAAPVARAFGASMEETAALTGVMANAGVKASQAGTSLRAGFLRLAGPPKKSQKAMEELGISLSEATAQQQEAQAALQSLGINMDDFSGSPAHKMAAVLGELRTKTEGLSGEQKLATMQAIFGTEAATGWLNVLEAGPEVFNDLVAQMENCDGEAEKMAAVMMDNAQGAMTQFQSASEGAAIAIGTTFLPYITELLNQGAGMAKEVADWAKEHQDLVMYLGLAAAGIAGLIVAATGIAVITAAVSFVVAQFQLLNTTLGIVSKAQAVFNAIAAMNPYVLIAIAVIALVGALIYLWNTNEAFRDAVVNTWEWLKNSAVDIFASIGEFLVGVWAGMKNGVVDAFNAVVNFIKSLPSRFIFAIGFIAGVLSALPGLIWNAILAAGKFIMELPGMIWNMVVAAGVFLAELPGKVIEAGVNFIIAAVAWLTETYNTVVQWISRTINDTYNWLIQLPARCAEAGANFVAAARQWATDAYNAVVEKIRGIPGAISDAISGAWSNIKSTFSAGFSVGVNVAQNAAGGIYGKGAFLTTFAEKSPEAAIPLDGSRRALSLWQQAGQMLGVMPTGVSNLDTSANMTMPKPVARPVAMEPPSTRQEIKMEFSPTINITGGNAADVGEIVKQALREQAKEFEARFSSMLARAQANEKRLSMV